MQYIRVHAVLKIGRDVSLGQLEKQGMGNGNKNWCKSCMGRDDLELLVIFFTNRTRVD